MRVCDDDELRQSSVIFLLADADEHRWIFEKLAMVAQSSNAERFGFDLSGFFQELQLAQYMWQEQAFIGNVRYKMAV